MEVSIESVCQTDIIDLLETHLETMRSLSPPEAIHALDIEKLMAPEITFWTVREGETLIGCGALKEIASDHGEIKSVHTARAHCGRGAGTLLTKTIIETARQRGYQRISLETGPPDRFAAAHALYARLGFEYCGPFGDYPEHPFSHFMTLGLCGEGAEL